MKVRLRIDGVDRSSLLPRTGWTLEDSEGKRISTLSLPLEDRSGALAASALELKELILDDPDAPTTRYFLGLVTQIETRPLEGVGLVHDIVSQEYGWLLDHYFVTKIYTSQTDKAIIANAFSVAGLTEIDASTLVVAGATITRFVMNNMSLREMMDALAEITNFIWYVDWQKRVVYQSATASAATITLSDAVATGQRYQGLAQIKDYTGIVTKVIIQGGLYLSAAQYVILGSNAQDTVVASGIISTGPSESQALPDVWTNTGTDPSPVWTARTVGSKAAGDTLTNYYCLFNWIDRTLEFTTAPPNLTKSYRLYGRAQQAYKNEFDDKALEAAIGRTIAITVRDEDITTDAQAEQKANAIFQQRGSAREKVVLTTREEGLRSGQLIRIINAKLGMDKYYSIRRVLTRFLGGTLASYELTLTNPTRLAPDVLDMLSAGWRASQPIIPYRDSEMLVVFMSFTETALSLAETVLSAFESSKTYRVIADPVSIWPFDEGQGTTGEDLHGSNDLTLFGAPTWAQGRRSYALQLNGSTQYAKKTTASNLPATAITIAGWVYFDKNQNYSTLMSHETGDIGGDGGWWLDVDANGQLRFTVRTGGVLYTATKAGLALATWYHVAGVYDGSRVKVYIDGIIGTDAELVGAALDAAGDLYIGADDALANYLDGLLDELYLFPTALSATSISYLRDFKEIRAGFWKVAA